MVLTDCPISKIKDDKLNRAHLAKKIALIISSFKGNESFVVGLESPWGNGKTSVINMIRESLPKSISVLYFNPWNFSDEQSLLSDFFDSYLKLVKDEQEVTSSIKKYSKKLSFSFNPEIRLGLFSIGLGNIGKKNDDTETASELRKKIDDSLRKTKKRVLVIIDDIDRLDGAETKLIFKLVKQTANFPNTTFLLAYDRGQVEKRLSNKDDEFDGAEYLKKIVQVSFALPEPDSQQFLSILFSEIDISIEEIYGKSEDVKFDSKRWGNMLHGGFKNLFINIRDIKRYISTLQLDWSIVGKYDVSPVDFLGIEAIRVFAPKFYSGMAANKILFTSTGDYYMGSRDNAGTRKKQYEELLNLVPEGTRESINGICKELFPQLNFNTSYGSSFQQDWRKECRVCSEERFDVYFALGIPLGSVSESEMEAVMRFTDRSSLYDSLMGIEGEGKIRKVLSRMVDYLDRVDSTKRKDFILAIWDIQNTINDERTGIWDFNDIDSLVLRIGYQLISKLPQKERYKLLSDSLKETNSIYPAIHLVGVLIEEFEKKSEKPNETVLLDKSSTEKLRAQCAKKIEEYALKDMSKDKHFAFLLFRWKSYTDGKKLNIYLDKLVADKAGAVDLVASFAQNTFSQGFDDYVSTKSIKLDRDALGKIYSLAKIEKSISALTKTDLKKLSAEQNQAVTLFVENKKEDF